MTLSPSKDNTLLLEDGGRSNGSGSHLFAGKVNALLDGSLRRAVIAFDVDAAIPPGATITSVRLTLSLSRTLAGEESVAMHRLLADWGEGASKGQGNEGGGNVATTGDATWTHRFFDSDLWATAGGDFVSTASASAAVAGIGPYTWESTDALVADVQAWLDGTAVSGGWILIGNETDFRSAKRFDSREATEPDDRPILVVTFIAP